ncbi:hypothetical protein STANM309S_00580 [Streptomyces tanashiensis]
MAPACVPKRLPSPKSHVAWEGTPKLGSRTARHRTETAVMDRRSGTK